MQDTEDNFVARLRLTIGLCIIGGQMQEHDTITDEECDYRIGYESCPLVRHDALRNTKAGDNVAEDKVTNRGRRSDLEWLGLNPLGKEIGGHDNELMLL